MKAREFQGNAHPVPGGWWSVVMLWALAIGFFVQISGKVWLVSGSGRNAQIYLWLLLPALIFSVYKVVTRKGPKPDLYYLPWALFLGWVALSTLWATDSDANASSLAKRGLFIGLYLVAIHLLFNRQEVFFRRALLLGLVAVTVGALASLIYQYGFLQRPLAYRAFRIDRSGIGDIANYGWPVAAGIFHGAVATWVLGIALDKRIGHRLAVFWLLCFAVLSLYVLLTYTRGAWIALMTSCAVAVIMHNNRRGWLLMASGLLALLLAVFLWWDKLVFEATHRQLSGRGPIWDYFFSTMPGNWWFGHGLGTPFHYVWPNVKAVSPHAHSLYLQQIYDSGLISLSLLTTGLLGLLYKVWILRNEPWVRLAFPSLIFALVAMLTDVERIFTRPGDYWTVFWLPVAVLLALPPRTKKPGLTACSSD
ncbi:O-antigen ligase family protein [Pseudomonas sp. UM16]|uniref:O-antigen ligase family protein n=1 Tax=Pseudomonas sp. UM16 TaxID=3158962 RepID=UPI003990052F